MTTSTNPTRAAIGIDLGHSSVKISVKSTSGPLENSAEIFPTVVRNWTHIANDATAKKAAVDTVEVEGRKFFVGVTAVRQGQADNFTGQNRNWVDTIQHDALLVSAWNRSMEILSKNGITRPEKIALVLGLPTSYYLEQRGQLRMRANQLINPLLTGDQKLEVFIQSQSRAPLICVNIDQQGKPTGAGGDAESWGVVEIGHFTTDFTFHDRGQEVDSAASSASGAHLVYDHIASIFKQKGYLSDFESITEAIQTKKIKVYGQDIDVSEIVNAGLAQFSTYILDEVTTRFGEKAQRMDGIIVAGGGSAMVGGDIKARFPNAIIPPSPRYAVAEGYSRFGMLRLLHAK